MTARSARLPIGSLLLLGLTYAVLWLFLDLSQGGRWSAVQSLLFAYLVYVAPLMLGRMAYKTWRQEHPSRLHWVMRYASTGYFLLLLLGFFWIV